MNKNYYYLYQKYKKKYIEFKYDQFGSSSQNTQMSTLYSITDIDPIYNLEKYDFLHRPSAVTDDFNRLLSIYNKLNSIPFNNDYFINFIQNFKINRRVKYYTKNELLSHKCEFEMFDNKIFIKCQYLTDLVQSKVLNTEYLIYIMNPEGDIFISKKGKNNLDGIITQKNHTSLSRGNSVSAAGTFGIDFQSTHDTGFQLITASNFSGHYKADEAETFNFLNKLINSNIDLENLIYDFREPEGDISEYVRYRGNELVAYYKVLITKYNSNKLSLLDYQIYEILNKMSYSDLPGDYIITGSIIYKEVINADSDVDSIFIFHTRTDLEKFLTDNKTNVHEFFFSPQYQFIEFTEEEIDLFLEKNIEIIRLSAITNGRKITIKLFSYDKFNLSNSDFCRVFIKNKNKRLYKTRNLITNDINDILLFNNSFNDVNIIIDKNYIDNGITKVPGLITDMLLTGKLKYSLGNIWEKFSEQLLKQYLEIYLFEINKCNLDIGAIRMSNLIIRSDRQLSDMFQDSINTRFRELYSKYKENYCNPIENFVLLYDYNLWEKPELYTSIIRRNISELNRPNILLTNETLKEFLLQKEKINEGDDITIDNFTSVNSSNPNIKTISKDSKEIYLCKFARNEQNSMSNSIYYESTSYKNLVKFYKKGSLIEPFVDDSYNHVCYDFKQGFTELIDCISRHDSYSIQERDNITKLELERHEDLTKGFLLSINNEDSRTEPIHQLFYNRIIEGNRWSIWGYDTLFNREVRINNVIYNKIDIEKIRNLLNPENLNRFIKIYGFTDNHGGNVLISEDKSKFYNIDYEYCSISHPCQNISKSIFNDIYGFANFDFDIIEEFSHDENTIFTTDFSISNFKLKLLKMKIDGILSIVLRKFKEINNDYIEDWEDILRASLFVCCGMTKQIEYNREKLIEEQKLELLDTKSKNLFVLSYVFLNDIKSIETGEIKPFYLNTLLNNLRLELK